VPPPPLHSPPFLLDRRRFLAEASGGIGAMALASLLQADGLAGSPAAGVLASPHVRPRAKRVIHIFSPGGVSQVDTFDHKPKLAELDGKPLTGLGKVDTFFGKPGVLRKTVYRFRRYGESGAWVSDLFPHLAGCVDDLTFFHAVVSKSSSHTPACFQMNTGFTLNGYPSLGAWLSYGLGTENAELPTFIVLPDPRGLPNGGTNNWSQGFLPAKHQGTPFGTSGKGDAIPHLRTPLSVAGAKRRAGLELLKRMNRRYADANPRTDDLAARISSYELAARMQTSIPEAIDFRDETRETQELYGLHDKRIAASARNFLLARRLVERGVRFVQIFNGGALGSPRINWDAHEDVVRNHNTQGLQLDRPCAALLRDLKRRGLLEDTLVFWSSEFGRTPFTEGINGKGRDHHPLCFTVWMAGAGLKPGFHYGKSDELGYKPAEHATSVYDLHATLLHLLGIDHERLTFYHNGIQRRLTDVHGHVVRAALA
jgi:hypothetical protein